MHTTKLTLFALVVFLSACGQEGDPVATSAGEATVAAGDVKPAPPIRTDAPQTKEELMKLAPPPPLCYNISETEVLDIFGAGTQIPMPGHRSVGTFNSCQYEIVGPERAWSGNLILEQPTEDRTVQTIIDEIAGTPAKELIEIDGKQARFSNGYRILSVGDESYPWRVKFSALPSKDNDDPFTEEERKEILLKLAQAYLTT